jgi:hypothetical protein
MGSRPDFDGIARNAKYIALSSFSARARASTAKNISAAGAVGVGRRRA